MYLDTIRFFCQDIYDRAYQYIPLSEEIPQVVTIPRGVLHGAINFGDRDCLFVNAVLRHGKPSARDDRAVAKPFPYDMEQAKLSLQKLFEAKA